MKKCQMPEDEPSSADVRAGVVSPPAAMQVKGPSTISDEEEMVVASAALPFMDGVDIAEQTQWKLEILTLSPQTRCLELLYIIYVTIVGAEDCRCGERTCFSWCSLTELSSRRLHTHTSSLTATVRSYSCQYLPMFSRKRQQL